MRKYEAVIVDDDEDDVYLLQEVLAGDCFTIKAVLNTAEDLQEYLSRESAPDIVISDFFLPGKSVHEVVKEVRTEKHNAEVIYVLLTGADLETTRQITDNGHLFDGIYNKPLDFQEWHALHDALMDMVSKKAAERPALAMSA
jgi:CheY-like chemotaxis protein